MTRLDREHDVLQLARDLGVSVHPSPANAVIEYCRRRVADWVAENGGVRSISSLESLVARRLQLVFEEFLTDEELKEGIRKYTSQGEGAFAALAMLFDEGTYGTLLKRSTVSDAALDRYVAFIDCRKDKATRRFFTRWHEIAHLLTLTSQAKLPAHRSTDHPLERLMDDIAGRIGFCEPLFRPILDRHYTNGRLSLQTVDATREQYCPEASFQASLFACLRHVPNAVVYFEAQLGYKADEERRLKSRQMSMFREVAPVAKLRVSQVIPNALATEQRLQVIQRMRVPQSSIVYRVFDGSGEEAVVENLNLWEFSNGGDLGDRQVWVEARRLPDRVIALVQPVDTG